MSALGPCESFYASAVQQPWLLWAAALVGWAVVIVLRDRPRSIRWFASGCAVLAMLDAWLTASDVLGLGALPGVLGTTVPLFFVLAGDLRVFLFLDLVAVSENRALRIARARWGRILALTMLVPGIAFGLVKRLVDSLVAPELAGRMLFLGYELLFLALILIIRQRVLPRQLAGRDPLRSWAGSVAGFVAAYYGLWALADLWILFAPTAIRDLGFALRVLPNALYYGGLSAWIVWRWPSRAESGQPTAHGRRADDLAYDSTLIGATHP